MRLPSHFGSYQDTPFISVLPMPASIDKTENVEDEPTDELDQADDTNDSDAEFGGTEARKVLEKKLLRKLDARCSILIVIYILNYVCMIFRVHGDHRR